MAYIHALATAVPDFALSQKAIAARMIKGLSLPPETAEALTALYQNSAIETRYSVLPQFEAMFKGTGTRARNEIYKEEAPKLACRVASDALAKWGGDKSCITHVISVSCTGMMAPGLEFLIIDRLGLPRNCGRIGINFMGCYGAFNALTVASALAKENPRHRILLVCTELCSLHAQVDLTPDTILANTLFSDGAAALVIGGEGPYLWEIVKRSSEALENSQEQMTWESGDTGYFMKLSNKVPVLIKRHIASFCQDLRGDNKECSWAIHPGGKAIIQAIEKSCGLVPEQTAASHKVLSHYGNMSSATFLFVLEESLKKPAPWTLGVGFGPGLSIEGVLLKCSPSALKP